MIISYWGIENCGRTNQIFNRVHSALNKQLEKWTSLPKTKILSVTRIVYANQLSSLNFIETPVSTLYFTTTCKLLTSFIFCISLAKHGDILEFSDICKKYLGKPGELVAIIFSLAAIAGSAIVFWVLMSNFLFNSGKYIQGMYSICLLFFNFLQLNKKVKMKENSLNLYSGHRILYKKCRNINIVEYRPTY